MFIFMDPFRKTGEKQPYAVADPGFPTGGVNLLSPPANEVWDKVMFLHLSVSHSVHRMGTSVSGSKGHTPWTHTHSLRTPPRGATQTHTHPWTHTYPRGHTPLIKVHIEAGGTHPTRMHSFFQSFYQKLHENERNWTERKSGSCQLSV